MENENVAGEVEKEEKFGEDKSSPVVFAIIGIIVLVFAGVAGVLLLRSNQIATAPTTKSTVAIATPSTQEVVPVSSESAIVASGSASPSAGLNVKTIKVAGNNYSFEPSVIRVKQGDHVRIVFTSNEGVHDLVIGGLNVATERVTGTMTDTVEFTADKKGSFGMYCSVDSHKDKGMEGMFIVE